jgi:acetyltransferase-like isoleucine patch superfamily enzyme
VKIGDRLTGERSLTEIGEGSFLGIGCVIQMNVRIGKHVVVGSNSVVKKSVPDFSVVEGNPAEVVMAYNQIEDRWVNLKR